MSEQLFQLAIFAVIESLTKAELSDQGKKLIINYYNESPGKNSAEKAREAITRYTIEPLPSLDQIRAKSKTQELDELDHLLLKLEYQAGHYTEKFN